MLIPQEPKVNESTKSHFVRITSEKKDGSHVQCLCAWSKLNFGQCEPNSLPTNFGKV